MARQEGQFLVEDFFTNSGGLNTADSPFIVSTDQSTGGENYDYMRKGGFQKRKGHAKLNEVANAELRTLGLGLFDKPSTARAVIRSAARKIQYYDINAITLTNLTEDTLAVNSNFWAADSVIPVVNSMFNTATSGALWLSGAGAQAIYGAYSSTKVTANGVDVTSGTVTTGTTAGSSTFVAVGLYRYAFALYKGSTTAVGNCVTECSVTIAATTDLVTLTLTSLGAIDTTKYTKLYIYRSAVAGAAAFTTGDLVKTLDISAGVPSTTTDTGTALTQSVNVPRAGNLIVDNSALPSATYPALTTFKRRLVTASKSTLYLSDLNKPESWPTVNTITVPSGGDITGLAVISYNTPYSSGTDELLCIFKQRELWIITGSSISDWSLKFIDNSGCPNQSLIVAANGYVSWLGYRGVYLWDGAGKPAYISQLVEDKFQSAGEIDKSLLDRGFGVSVPSRNEIQWYLTSSAAGTQKMCLKLDLRLTMQDGNGGLNGRQLKGIFTPDTLGFSAYAGLNFLPSASASEELFYLADASGFLYSAYVATAESGAAYSLKYLTPFLNFGSPSTAKRLHKIVLWVLDSGSFNIDVDYWSNYRYSDADASTQTNRVSSNLEGASLTWDVGAWDEKYWDASSLRVKALVYNPYSTKNNTEGDSIRLRIRQTGSTDTVVIYGFSLYYSEIGLRK